MKRIIMSVAVAIALAGTSGILRAQDPVKVDPKHYSVLLENAEVRVLKVHYGPGEKSTMHSHPDTVAVFLSDATGQFTFPDGKTEKFNVKAGEAIWNPAKAHLPENTGKDGFDVILVELKGRHAAKR